MLEKGTDMKKFGEKVVKLKWPIFIAALVLMIPCFFGMINTRINYDMLDYLPGDMETVQGQEILLEDFGKGAFSIIIVEGMEQKDVAALREKIEKVNHVATVVSYDSVSHLTIPVEVIPDKYYNAFNKGDATLVAVFFDSATSADETMDAIREVRKVCGEKCFVTGMSALVTDLKDLCEKEEPVYVGLAVACALVAMMIFMDSFLVPLIFLGSIGIAIMWNMGTNYFFGEISYITKALSAVLQLGVTMDYSIFLWHAYSAEKKNGLEKNDAMAKAISNTLTSVIGSSITTVAGFLALCFMSFTLGKDLGLVMAKGVVFGVIGCVTTLPALILIFDKAIEKTKHKALLPRMDKVASGITKYPVIFLLIFAIVMVPAVHGYRNTEKYYDMGDSLPKDMAVVIANSKLSEEFEMGSTHMILMDSKLPARDKHLMIKEIEKITGVKACLGLESIVGTMIPDEMLPESITSVLRSDKYEMLVISSEYKVASDNVNEQVAAIYDTMKKYDSSAMLIGEAPCMKDLIEVTDKDFTVVSWLSIAAIFIIIAIVFKSISLPVLLVSVIEFAIFINLGIPAYTGTPLVFVAPICISTIQLGATVDYAILMTTKYRDERRAGNDARTASKNALAASMPSIMVSALGFFAATIGVGIYSEVDIIGTMCNLMARGAIVSMTAVILVLPNLLRVMDKLIIHTSIGFVKRKKDKEYESEIIEELTAQTAR